MPATASHRSRFWLLIIVLLALVIAPFCVWGGWFEEMLDLNGAKAWMESLGPSAWFGGIALLVSDLVLPIPGTVVMSALGLVYGWFWGGVASVAGSVMSGMVAYALCWKFGHKPAVWLAGEDGLAKGELLFRGQRGGWIVALSRWMPVLPEAVACLAGLTRMPFRVFFIALLSGSVPLGFTFSIIGSFGVERPGLAIALSALMPAGLYAVAAMVLRTARRD
jgi:uncharacterized membrane protein YdjX (TVP38/TMEM64 family)